MQFYSLLPLPIFAFSLYSFGTNLLLAHRFYVAMLWLIPAGLSWSLRKNILQNGESLIKDLMLDQTGTKVKIVNAFGKESEHLVTDLREALPHEM